MSERLQATASEQAQNLLSQRRLLRESTAGRCHWIGVPHSCPAMAAASQARHVEPDLTDDEPMKRFSEAWHVRHLSLPPCPPQGRLPQSKVCFQQGMCTCKPGQAPLRKFCASVLSTLKVWFGGKLERGALDQSHVLLAFLAPSFAGKGDEQVFAHVALMYWKSFRPTLLLLNYTGCLAASRHVQVHSDQNIMAMLTTEAEEGSM